MHETESIESLGSGSEHLSDGGYTSIYHQTRADPGGLEVFAEPIRDPNDSLTISSLLRACGVVLALLAVSFGLNIFLAVRKADRIIVDKSSGRVVEIKNRDTDQASLLRLRLIDQTS